MTSHNPVDVIVVGSINADVTYNMRQLPAPGETVLSHNKHDAPGGKGANQSVAIASFDIDVAFVAAVGHDEQGFAMIESLGSRGVRTSHIFQLHGSRTGSAVILVDAMGENSIVVHPGANHDLSPESVFTTMEEIEASVVLAQLEVPIESVLAAARSHVGTFVLNPAPISADISTDQIKSLLEHADILVPNRSELAALVGMAVPSTLQEVRECAIKLDFLGTLIVTLGSDGALLFIDSPRSEPLHVPSPEVSAIDTSGAGDAFCGALVASLVKGHSLVESVVNACAFASWTTTQIGAQVSRGHGFSV